MGKRYMVPMFLLATAETEVEADRLVIALQELAMKHGFSLLQDELVHPKSFNDDTDEIHSILDLVPAIELTEPYGAGAGSAAQPQLG